MDFKKILLTGGGIALIFVLLLVAYYATNKPQATYFETLTKTAPTDRVKWATESANILIEYSDFQCPACSSYSGLIESLDADDEFVSKIKENVTFVYRHFPLDSAHPFARIAAQAAEAAGQQGKFFEMHDLLFTNQSEWAESDKPEELFKEYATELELDMKKFQTDMMSSEIKDRIQNDYLSGLDIDVRGTPTFYLNGYKLQNPNSTEHFKELLLEGIESKDN